MTVTELATFPLKSGHNAKDANSPAGQICASVFQTLGQQDGYQDCVWGLEEENPSIMQMFINWNTLEDHTEKFMKSADYPPMLKRLGSLIDGAPNLTHFTLEPASVTKTVFSAPITECVTAYLASQSSSAEESFKKFADIVTKEADGCVGVVGGWSVEEVEHEKLDSGKGKAYWFGIGWQSLEAHMAFRETESFKKNIGLLRTEEVKHIEMHHVKMQLPM